MVSVSEEEYEDEEGSGTSSSSVDELDTAGVPMFLRGGGAGGNLEIMLQSSPCGLVVADALADDHPIVYVNSIFEVMTGYKAEEILGKNCRFLQFRGAWAKQRHPLVDVVLLQRIRECLAAGVEFRGRLLNFRKDGAPLLNSLVMRPIRNNTGQVTHFVGIQNFSDAKLDLGPLPVKESARSSIRLEEPRTSEHGSLEAQPSASTSGSASILDVTDEVLMSKVLSHLSPRDLVNCALCCRRFYRLALNEDLWRSVCQTAWGRDTTTVIEQAAMRGKIGWGRVARELTTLEAAAWKKLTVGGAVEPSRCNFSACAVGNKLVLFGGEGVNMQPMNDLFVLDLSVQRPEWRHVDVSSAPPGRWGHTLSCLNSSWLVLFGGCGRNGHLNDVFMLDLDEQKPVWREVAGAAPPLPRSWHGSCTVDGRQLVVFGGCTDTGRLLSDTFLLDLAQEHPVWREIPVRWRPPSRLGHSMSVYDGSKVAMFGGLATSGPLRVRSSDVFTLDLKAPEPSWRYITGSSLPGAGQPSGTPPPPRLDHVALSLPGGRVLIFGGSVAGLNSPLQLYVLDPKESEPTWRMLSVVGVPPKHAWGHSTCVVGGTRAVLLGGFPGEEWLLNELHELSLLSPFPALQ